MRRLLLSLLLATLAACSSSSGGTAPDAPAGDAGAPSGDDASPPPDPTAAACASVLAVVQPALDASLKDSGSTDASIGVRTRDCPFVSATTGTSKLAPQALYRVGSITKTYTAAVILHFVAAGTVGLDDTVARFSLGIPNDAQITLRQLLDHTSGIFNYTDDPAYPSHLDWTPQERLQIAAMHAPYGAPGATWHYSNTNFIALGLIAESLGGAPIASLVRQIVLAPRGLAATFFDGGEPVGGTIAPSYANGSLLPIADGRFGAWADGAIVSSLGDVTAWMRAWASGDATPMLKADLQRGIPETVGSPETYGLALMILAARETGGYGKAYGHGGDIPGFHSLSFFFPDHEWTVTAIVNDDAGDPNATLLATIQALGKANK
jgi:D-alanyl-D-alanine carboxypeptidase